MSGIDWATEKFRRRFKGEIQIPNEGNISFITETPFPYAQLYFKVQNNSDINLAIKSMVAGVYWGGMLIDKISWQESTYEKTVSCHNIPNNLPARRENNLTIYYPLPLNVDFGKFGLSLQGMIRFDFGLSTLDKELLVNFNLPETNWKEAIDKWRKFKNKDSSLTLMST
ncbi:MAG: hypothetical protein WC556_09460 [Candidatus Methanoperedens sp.]